MTISAMTITAISITTIVSMQTLGASVGVAGGMTIAISWLSISRPLVNVVTIGVMGRSIAISRLSFSKPLAIAMTTSIATIVSSQPLCGSVYRAAATIGMVSNTTISTIARLSFSRPLTIAMSISIATIVSMQTLWASVCVAAASIRMIGNTSIAIARLGSSQAGKGHNNCYNLSCHGYV